MPKAATKKKAPEPANPARHAKQKDRHDSFEQRDEEEDGLFVSQSPPPQGRGLKRTNANRPVRAQPSSSRMDDGDGFSNMDFDKYERAQSKRGAGTKRPNKPSDEFHKLAKSHNTAIEKEIREILTHRIANEQSFSATFHTTLTSIITDGYPAFKGVERDHLLRDTTKTVLSKAQRFLHDSQGSTRKLSSSDAHNIFKKTEENWAFDFQSTERILEVGRLVGEDKMAAKLNGVVPIVHDPHYSDASAALFAADGETGTENKTWARTAKDQGRLVKSMTAAIGQC